MTKIRVYDPAMCCSTGVCGPTIDPALVCFSADADWAKGQEIDLVRYNLSQEPMAFVNNSVVKQFLNRSGAEALPLILVEGEIALAGRYPTREELVRWAGLAAAPAMKSPSGGCCGGSGTC
ncbi:MAG: arsenite efflux transporter metallochaperone ArsD [Acidithiobacillus sp.]